VLWTPCLETDFTEEYWNDLWGWYKVEGNAHVAQYLKTLDISDWNPKATPPKTQTFWDIVGANMAPEDAELADVIDNLGNPKVITLEMVIDKATGEFRKWCEDRRNRRNLPHRFEQCGYMVIRCPTNKLGLWRIQGVRQVIYAHRELSPNEQLTAAQVLTNVSENVM
jgi:hypothetical protein